MLVNAYTTYQMVMEENDVPRNKWISHFEFRRAIAMAWVACDEPTMGTRQKEKEARRISSMETANGDSPSTHGTNKKRTSSKSATTNSRKRRKCAPESTQATQQQQQQQQQQPFKCDRAPTLKDNKLSTEESWVDMS
jgi:hypothetical protein